MSDHATTAADPGTPRAGTVTSGADTRPTPGTARASTAPGVTRAEDELLEPILDAEVRGESVTVAALAERTGTPVDQVAAAVEQLVVQDVVVQDGDQLAFTPAGRTFAGTVVRKHRLAERLLQDVIGLEWSKIHREAVAWEGVISDDVERKLVDLLADPGSCPHGNPIPGSANRPDQSRAVPLTEVAEGRIRIVRITESLEEEDDALRLLEGCGAIPGRDAEVAGRHDAGVKVIGPVADAVLPTSIATRVFVEPS